MSVGVLGVLGVLGVGDVQVGDVQVGDVVTIKSLKHWSKDFQKVDDQYFQAGFVKGDATNKCMEAFLGQPGQVTEVSKFSETDCQVEIDFTFMGKLDCYCWDLHSVKEILTREEFPEYYL